MSHQPERKEKNCLNCGTKVEGRYCHVCGQENIIPKQNFWILLSHFISDIFHFDGKFFYTFKRLIQKPGSVSIEYIQGKRVRYLDPIRMYLFTSAVFFLLFFSIGMQNSFTSEKYLSKADRYNLIARLYKDSSPSRERKLQVLLDTNKNLRFSGTEDNHRDTNSVELYGNIYKVTEGDLIRPDSDGSWIIRKISNAIQRKYKSSQEDVTKMTEDFTESFYHKLPYLFFLSLPVFALILKLLYARKKGFYFSDHAVFTLHHYIISFLLFLSLIIVEILKDKWGRGIFNWIIAAILIYWPVYLFMAMKRFYRQGWVKTFVKFTLLNILGITTLIFLFVVYTLFIIIV